MTILNDNDQAKLRELVNLLDEAYRNYFAKSDGHCKSAEGAVRVHLGDYFTRSDGDFRIGVSVYSYVLGPHRDHHFDSIDEALDTVRRWHKAEMEHDYEADEAEWDAPSAASED